MTSLVESLRFWDYHIYLTLHGAIAKWPWMNSFYLFFAKYGIILIVLSFIYLIVRRKIHAFICSFIASFIASVVATLIQLFWRRPRPYISHGDDILRPITAGLHVAAVSFPSAHTFISFSIATSIYLYGHRRLGAGLYLVAFLVAVGRVGAGLHYPSDVIAGAILGIISGVIAYRVVDSVQMKWE